MAFLRSPWRLLLAGLLLFAAMAQPAQAQLMRKEGLPDGGIAETRTWIDVNGDGRDDFCFVALGGSQLHCYYSDGANFGDRVVFSSASLGTVTENIRWADVNGDGLPDVCRLNGVPNVSSSMPQQGSFSCYLGPAFTSATSVITIPFNTIGEWQGEGYVGATPGLDSSNNLFLADVNGDSKSDLCYVYLDLQAVSSFRCRLSNVSGNSGSFDAETAAWTRQPFNVGLLEWPKGFHDFNGDGYADFCRILGGSGAVQCTLSSAGGFVGADVASTNISSPKTSYPDGAAFVDFNADGKTDFCRIVGSSGLLSLSCKISNGAGWESTERYSQTIANSDIGLERNRWWVDINADGFPDYCRAVKPGADFIFRCRLGRGDGDLDSLFSFGFTDVQVVGYTPGEEKGRGFCDAIGNGVQTYCRLTVTQTGTSEFCYVSPAGRRCFPIANNSIGVVAGLVDPTTNQDTALQARQPLITALSDGAGAETRITYLSMTAPAVYTKSAGTGTYPWALLVQPRAQIVSETRAWRADGSAALTGTARYFFKDLRSDLNRGSRGFRERWIFTEGSNTLDHVVHYQGLGPGVDAGSIQQDMREVGLVKLQERFAVAAAQLPAPTITEAERTARLANVKSITAAALSNATIQPIAPTASSPFMLLQSTTNTLADTVPVNSRYRYLGTSVVKSWDWNGNTPIVLPETQTTTELDDVANVKSLVQITRANAAEWSKKITTNTYTDNRSLWLLGRLATSKVVSEAPLASSQLSAYPSSAGTSPTATAMSSNQPSAPQPISPAALSAILQLLLED